MTDRLHSFGELAKAMQGGGKPPATPTKVSSPSSPGHEPGKNRDERRHQLEAQKNNLEYQVAQLKLQVSELHIKHCSLSKQIQAKEQTSRDLARSIKELSDLLDIAPEDLAKVAADREAVDNDRKVLEAERAELTELKNLLEDDLRSAKETAATIVEEARRDADELKRSTLEAAKREEEEIRGRVSEARKKLAELEASAEQQRTKAEKALESERRTLLRVIRETERQSKAKVEESRDAVYQREMKVAAKEKKLEAWTKKIERLQRENGRLRGQLAELLARTGQQKTALKLLDHEAWPKAVDRAVAMAKPKMGPEMKLAIDQLKTELAAQESDFLTVRNAAMELEAMCRMLSGIDASSGSSSGQVFLGMLGPFLRNNAPLCRKVLGPRAVTTGSIPLLPKMLDSLLGYCCVEVCSVEEDCPVWIVGRSGWSEDDLDRMLAQRTGKELRVFSHELLIASLACGGDMFAMCSPEDLYALGADHPALTYLYDKGFDWPRAVVPKVES